jgi:Sigma-70 region 2
MIAVFVSQSPSLPLSFPQQFVVLKGINPGLRSSDYVDLPGTNLQLNSFEELAIPLFDQLYNFAHWLTQNRDEAEDLVQETYVKALKGFSSFQLGTNFRAWIYRILRNTFLTSRKGLKVTMTLPLDFDDEEEGPEPAIERECHGVPSQSLNRTLCGACLRRTTRSYAHPGASAA